jgi:uncharacterized protein YoxC
LQLQVETLQDCERQLAYAENELDEIKQQNLELREKNQLLEEAFNTELARLNSKLAQKEESVRAIQSLNEQYKSKCQIIETELQQKAFDTELL